MEDAMIKGVSVFVMHDISMKGISFCCALKQIGSSVTGDATFPPIAASSNFLACSIGFIVLFILFITVFIAYFEQYKSLKSKRLMEQHYRCLVDYHPFLVLTVNLDGIVTHVNPKGIEFLDCDAGDITATSIFSYFRNEDLQIVTSKFEAAKNGKACSCECFLVNKHEKKIPMHMTFIPIVSEQKVYGVFVVGQDITEIMQYKRRVQKAQRDLLDTVRQQQGMIFKFVKKGDTFIHTLCDGELLYKLGFTSRDIIGKSLYDFLPKEQAEQKTEYYQKAWNGETIYYEMDMDGIFYLASLCPIQRNGKVIEVIGSAIDITDRKKMERAILLAKEEAEKANIAKSELISKMSHELRTPLNGILGFAQLLEIDDSLTKQQKEFVEKILSGGRHLLNLVNEILDLSRIESGNLKISPDYVQLERVIDESIKLIQPLADEKNIRIIKSLEQDENELVYVDPVRLKQIMINLLSNAVKYNRQNGVVIISSRREKGNIYIHVQDSGIGIAKEEWEKIFEPFYRIKGTHADGTGIGLSLVKQLVRLMGGEVGMNSTLGEGSDFWFSIPVVKNVYHDERCDRESGKHHRKRFQSMTKKILYIEDNETNLQLVKKIFEPYPNITLRFAVNGQEGIEVALNEKVDLILLDIHLPDMSGYEVFEILQENEITKSIPVIALSAYAMKDEIQKVLKKGFAEYLTKPINIEQFLETIEKLLT
jgi:PAS domain S-box-containing protein